MAMSCVMGHGLPGTHAEQPEAIVYRIRYLKVPGIDSQASRGAIRVGRKRTASSASIETRCHSDHANADRQQ